MKIMVTGGAGFIGSHFVESLVKQGLPVVVVDALTYAGHRENLEHLPPDSYQFVKADICDGATIQSLLSEHHIRAVFNFAAETHVDRSITGPSAFVETNVVGTSVLLSECLKYWEKKGRPQDFRYLQVSTDEVYGSLDFDDPKFTENSPFAPNSPYSASKAGADFLVRAWHHTYGLPTLITHCSNNYGPRQYPEKLIPAMIARALRGEKLGVYGDGRNVRDWLHVTDHCRGIFLAYKKGKPGEHYCFGGDTELNNLELVQSLCDLMQDMRPPAAGQSFKSYRDLIAFVTDRPGHDKRYAIDFTKANRDLGFAPTINFKQGFRDTISWYLKNTAWTEKVSRKEHA